IASTAEFTKQFFSAELFDSFEGPLKLNNILSSAEHQFENKIHGPESLVFKNGYLYTSTFGGTVVRIEGSQMVPIVKIGDGNCDTLWDLEKCGRPLGLRFNSEGKLYVVDAYHGLYVIESIETTERKVTQLLPLSATKNLQGGESKFFDDITIEEGAGEQGGDVIYISDVSTKWHVSSCIYTLVEYDTTGRLLRFDTDSKKLTIVDSGFVFLNGIQITDDEDSILMCELGRQRILQTFISGPKSGRTEIFAKLPGPCDNIRRSANRDHETYWVAFAFVRNSSNPVMFDRLSESPLIRTFVSRLLYFSGELVEIVGELFYSETLKATGYSLKKGIPFFKFVNGHGMIAEYDANGEAITSYSSLDGKTGHLSEVCEVEGDNGERVLYLGSYSNSYLGKLVVKK
ncbi:Adipocyte plasma membrane-associated protein, partial [Pseudolycoriella hygida]